MLQRQEKRRGGCGERRASQKASENENRTGLRVAQLWEYSIGALPIRPSVLDPVSPTLAKPLLGRRGGSVSSLGSHMVYGMKRAAGWNATNPDDYPLSSDAIAFGGSSLDGDFFTSPRLISPRG
jgi:hypothetical protein